MNICVDLDGTIASWRDGWRGITHFGPPIEGAREFLQELMKAGHYIIVHTCRTNPYLGDRLDPETGHKYSIDKLVRLIKDYLDANNLPYDDVWCGIGKPIADFYVDDKGVSCKPEKDADAYMNAIKEIHSLGK